MLPARPLAGGVGGGCVPEAEHGKEERVLRSHARSQRIARYPLSPSPNPSRKREGNLKAGQRRSGASASALSRSIASSSVSMVWPWLPSTRSATVLSSASRLPTTSRLGTLASECSRTL